MKPIRIIFYYSEKQPDVTRRQIKFFKTNLDSIIKINKVKPIFEVKKDTTAGINLRYKDLDMGKEIILENMDEIQQYLKLKQQPVKNPDTEDSTAISEDYSRYMLDVADEDDDDLDDKDDKIKNIANSIRMNSEKKKNEFKKQIEGKSSRIVGKRVKLPKHSLTSANSSQSSSSSSQSSSRGPGNIESQPSRHNMRQAPNRHAATRRSTSGNDSSDDALILSKIEQSNGRSID